MKIAVLTIDGRVVCCGPGMLALVDAVHPVPLPGWVDPSRWYQRWLIADALGTMSPFRFRPNTDQPERTLRASWSDVTSVSTSREGTWTAAR